MTLFKSVFHQWKLLLLPKAGDDVVEQSTGHTHCFPDVLHFKGDSYADGLCKVL